MFALSASKGRRNSELVQREVENGKQLVQKTEENDVAAVARLLDMGVSVNAVEYNRFLFYKSQNYMTPLQVAAKNGHTKLVQMFIDHDAELNMCDRFDTTAVHLAAEYGHTMCLRLLLDAGAECNLATKYSKQGSYTVPYIGGTTPLHIATQQHHLDCIRELILNGADYNAVDELGRTSMYIAAELGFQDAVLSHLHNAVGRDILSLPIKNTGETPLHECVRHGLLHCVSELLRHGSDVNHRNHLGFSPLHLALHSTDSFSKDVVRELVVNGFNANVNLRDRAGFHPLQYVCFHDNTKQERRPAVAAFLIAYGAQFEGLHNKHGMSILQNELQTISPDKTILQAVVKTLPKLPTWEAVGVMLNGNRLPPTLADKCEWYRNLCSSPRSLQHYCRCILRTALGIHRLKKVAELPLPNPLKHYLLLEYDEYR